MAWAQGNQDCALTDSLLSSPSSLLVCFATSLWVRDAGTSGSSLFTACVAVCPVCTTITQLHEAPQAVHHTCPF